MIKEQSRPRILSRPLVLFFASALGTGTGFWLLLPVVPSYATSRGAGDIGAGLATGALMLATVAGELITPHLAARFGQRKVYAAGLLLLGLPALALPAAAGMASILAICLVRGLGFAIVVVLSSTFLATLVPEERRGEGLGLYGIVACVPEVVGLPLGVWLSRQIGYPPLFVAGALVSMIGLLVVASLPDGDRGQGTSVSVVAGLRSPSMLRPALVFIATTIAGGIVATFLPLAVTEAAGGLAAAALLAMTSVATCTRWWAGRHGDRHGSAGLLVPGLLASALGLAAVALTANPAAVLAGMVVFGAGFGVIQNATLALMFERAPAGRYSVVSAIWNGAYDTGWGAGAAAFGLLATPLGYPVAFAVTAVLMLTALVPAWRDQRSA